MSVVFSRAPLRISLGGGGTDLPSYYARHGGFFVSGAIDKYVYMLTHTAFQRRYRMKYSELEVVDRPEDIRHPILREGLLRHWCGSPLEIASVADVPAGTGMGSSGAYAVCLLTSLIRARHMSIGSLELAEAACQIEMNVLGEPVGKQDPYVAAHGGICAYTVHRKGQVEVRPLELDPVVLRKLRDQLLLFYTGEARSASKILIDQDQRSRAGEAQMIDGLHHIKELGRQIHGLLAEGDLEGYAEVMHEHWLNKRQRSPGMANEHIDHLYELAQGSGAIGGKLVGAGGGGFLLVYTRRPEDTRQAMASAGAFELPFAFEFGGANASEYT